MNDLSDCRPWPMFPCGKTTSSHGINIMMVLISYTKLLPRRTIQTPSLVDMGPERIFAMLPISVNCLGVSEIPVDIKE